MTEYVVAEGGMVDVTVEVTESVSITDSVIVTLTADPSGEL